MEILFSYLTWLDINITWTELLGRGEDGADELYILKVVSLRKIRQGVSLFEDFCTLNISADEL